MNVTSYVASLLHVATPTNYGCMRDAFSVHMYIHSAIIHVSLHTHAHTHAHMHTCTHTSTCTHTDTHTIQDRLQLSVLRENVKLKPHIKCKGRPKHSSKLWPSKNTKAKGNRKENHYVKIEEMTPMRLQKSKEASITVQPGTAANRLCIQHVTLNLDWI